MAAIIFDLDGVFYVGDTPVPGAREALAWVQEMRIPHGFVTNTTSLPRARLVEKLAGFGMDVDAARILSPPVAAVRWIAERSRGDTVLFVPEQTREEFASLALARSDATGDIGAVVIGDLGEAWDYAQLNAAFRLLMLESAPSLIALGMTRYWQAPDGLNMDVAPFVAALQQASGAEPVVMGKPAAAFFEIALSMLGCKPSEVVMVGDDIRSDIDAAQQLGMAGVLVRTGKFRRADLDHGIEPCAVLESIKELPSWWPYQLD